ncbi:MAG TPA: GrpB family protein, partial [Iamia sp.]
MDEEGGTPDSIVVLVPPDRRWAERFAQGAATLRRVLPEALLIEHIGSTAVPGLVAKDTVDVLVVIEDLGIVLERAPALAVAGFDLRLGAPTTREDRLFLRRVVDGHRTHHVHVMLPSSPDVSDHLLFRDYLRASEAVRAEYELLKRRAAQLFPDSIDGYL